MLFHEFYINYFVQKVFDKKYIKGGNMPRISRSSINSKFVHVITQGIKKEYIFEKDYYKIEYMKLLNKILSEYSEIKIVAYCVMDNHAHFLIYIDEIKILSKVMSKLNTAYGIFYNNINNRVGYVFKNRFYSQEIINEKHLFNTLVYIHKNPVKAKIVQNEYDYKYSSYNDYIQNNVELRIINLLFNSEDYLNQFFYIHKNYSEENILEIKEEQEISKIKMKKVIEKFCSRYNCQINYIKKDNYLLILLIKDIRENCDVTNKMISEYIKIGKNRITNLMKENKKN